MEQAREPGSHMSSQQHNELEWDQVRATVTMLCLAVVQIESSLTYGANSVSKLTGIFTAMADYSQAMSQVLEDLKNNEQVHEDHSALLNTATSINHQIHEAVCAFQFYDRISQRLNHVSHSLDRLGTLLSNEEEIYSPDAWKRLQESIKSSYSMESERLMFEHVMRGMNVQEALDVYRHSFNPDESPKGADDDEVELF